MLAEEDPIDKAESSSDLWSKSEEEVLKDLVKNSPTDKPEFPERYLVGTENPPEMGWLELTDESSGSEEEKRYLANVLARTPGLYGGKLTEGTFQELRKRQLVVFTDMSHIFDQIRDAFLFLEITNTK